jgi:murein DD-endopeptidase MepM/ murein hydrolase activator NlpD
LWPAGGGISQYFVWYHKGLDIANKSAPGIAASDAGTVTYAGCLKWGYGCHVRVDHGNGYETLYAHLSRYYVDAGESVSRGQSLGQMGCTGRCTGTHLHLEIRKNGALVNPLSFLQ